MNRISQIIIGVGALLLVIALCVQGWVVVDLWGRTEHVLGEIRPGETYRSPEIKVPEDTYVQLQVQLGMFVRSTAARKRGYEVPFKYAFRKSNGTEFLSDKQVLKSSHVDRWGPRGGDAPNVHFMKPFKITEPASLQVVCFGSPSKTPQVSLETIQLTLLVNSPPYWSRLMAVFVLFPLGFYMALGGWVFHILKSRG